MAAKDVFHQVVKSALLKDGWTITDDPLSLQLDSDQVFIDLGAERLIAAQRDNEKIAVEIKSFLAPSSLSEFHTALGQKRQGSGEQGAGGMIGRSLYSDQLRTP
ncbi:MAG TPA: element excision factor XisH family protein [Leptolyngbyaceae cyanobacterium]